MHLNLQDSYRGNQIKAGDINQIGMEASNIGWRYGHGDLSCIRQHASYPAGGERRGSAAATSHPRTSMPRRRHPRTTRGKGWKWNERKKQSELISGGASSIEEGTGVIETLLTKPKSTRGQGKKE